MICVCIFENRRNFGHRFATSWNFSKSSIWTDLISVSGNFQRFCINYMPVKKSSLRKRIRNNSIKRLDSKKYLQE